MYLPEDIDDILNRNTEGEVLEFKDRRNNFDSRERSDYCDRFGYWKLEDRYN